MERAQYRCECGDHCGRKHTGGRCPNTDRRKDRLMAVSLVGDWRAPSADLTAMCPTCWRNWQRLAEYRRQADDDPEGLF
jgi:hypothetical protein